jgi:hypothetical protein
MDKRNILFGSYDTAAHGWTLTSWKLSDPDQKTKYVDKTGGDGAWDWSTVMTDGLPRYKDRSLTVTLECSEGTRTYREGIVSDMVNLLDGLEREITLPDHPDHYLVGRLHVAVNYNDLAHASVTVKGTCRPWLYKKNQTVITLQSVTDEHTATLTNAGRLALVPTLSVAGGSVRLRYAGASIEMNAGTYEWPVLLLTPGAHTVYYQGTGKLTVTYREAVLR